MVLPAVSPQSDMGSRLWTREQYAQNEVKAERIYSAKQSRRIILTAKHKKAGQGNNRNIKRTKDISSVTGNPSSLSKVIMDVLQIFSS